MRGRRWVDRCSDVAHSIINRGPYITSTSQHAPDSVIHLEASPSHLARGGLWVTVSWSGVNNPTEGDFIAAYAPLEADPASTAPIKYQYAAAADADHLQKGAGRVKFRLLEYVGGSYFFGFFRGNATRPVLAATSGPVSVGGVEDKGATPPEPQGIHLALTDQGDEMRVTWKTQESFFFIPDAAAPGSDETAADAAAAGVVPGAAPVAAGGDGAAVVVAADAAAAATTTVSDEPAAGAVGAAGTAGGKRATTTTPGTTTTRRRAAAAAAAVAGQEVQYAKASEVDAAKGDLDGVAWSSTAARTGSFARGDLCGEPATTVGFADPGSTHTAVMRGLEPGVVYAYRVGNAGACVCLGLGFGCRWVGGVR